jgi:plastocyanin domain-containing protein
MIFVNLVGVAIIFLIVWWFWIYKPEDVSVEDNSLLITVASGTYTPSRIKIEKHKAVSLTFLRKDPSPCAETLLIPDLNINETLVLNKSVTIELPGLAEGTYAFHCQMKMYKGELNVS